MFSLFNKQTTESIPLTIDLGRETKIACNEAVSIVANYNKLIHTKSLSMQTVLANAFNYELEHFNKKSGQEGFIQLLIDKDLISYFRDMSILLFTLNLKTVYHKNYLTQLITMHDEKNHLIMVFTYLYVMGLRIKQLEE